MYSPHCAKCAIKLPIFDEIFTDEERGWPLCEECADEVHVYQELARENQRQIQTRDRLNYEAEKNKECYRRSNY
ncbi:unnamed protein product [Auanema sp. JU1783]|nr:unnamed protein product [Auanema sp. JU1783]